MPGGRCTVTDTPSGGCQKNSMRIGCRPGSTWILAYAWRIRSKKPTPNQPSCKQTIYTGHNTANEAALLLFSGNLPAGRRYPPSPEAERLIRWSDTDDSGGLFHLQKILACSPCKPRPPNVKRPPSSESMPWMVGDDGNTRSRQVRPQTASWQLGLSKKQIALFSKTRKMYSPPRLIRK